MTEVVTLSTPNSKTTSRLELPSTPSKKPVLPNTEQFTLRNFTPSKPYRFSRPSIRSNSTNVIPQRLAIESNSLSESEDNMSPVIYEDALGRKLNNDNESISPVSDFGSVSPFCDVPPLPSYSPVSSKNEYIDPFNVDNLIWNPKPFAKKEAFELNKMLHSTLTDYKNKILSETRPIKKRKIRISKKLKHIPCHHYDKPQRSILKLQKGSLNLLVSSSKGSLQDATIFATEINATVNKEDSKLPLITNIWERITIPVNSEIKQKYKKIKLEWYGNDNYDDSADDEQFKFEDSDEFYGSKNEDNINDAALIRGFEFDSSTASYKVANAAEKTIRWATVLEH
ncbi:similar to Saccharomyces cerevisiae YOR315W SFG1 Nuclear protein [Maudiozyma saulgeensis]|uniref:Similar to Saccharomyces cerevisiae YOR315W SFG1 Nuclear protein n=1 Tax=Maudiozyma saulgeensis TaxID=1789683 RepID=A0A1X7R492_9SACH|nr:similar to Saccharomyces cerevisiae YOR315W SFG1 Nuclear protein [Kazachstania saulgeensis]